MKRKKKETMTVQDGKTVFFLTYEEVRTIYKKMKEVKGEQSSFFKQIRTSRMNIYILSNT